MCCRRHHGIRQHNWTSRWHTCSRHRMCSRRIRKCFTDIEHYNIECGRSLHSCILHLQTNLAWIPTLYEVFPKLDQLLELFYIITKNFRFRFFINDFIKQLCLVLGHLQMFMSYVLPNKENHPNLWNIKYQFTNKKRSYTIFILG